MFVEALDMCNFIPLFLSIIFPLAVDCCRSVVLTVGSRVLFERLIESFPMFKFHH